MTKKYLVIINECFPFDKGESFMENEIPIISGYDKIYICPCSVSDFKTYRKIGNINIKIIKLANKNSFSIKVLKVFMYVKCLFDPLIINEIILLAKNKKLNRSTIKFLLSFISVANNRINKIRKYLYREGVMKDDKIIFYSYWMDFHSYVAIKLKKLYSNSTCVTRCHGYDLYEYRNTNNYLPLRKYILENMDIVSSISNNGKQYLEKHFPNIKKNIIVSRLGTTDFGIREADLNRKALKIVSCSWVSPVKRVTRIIDALSQIQDISICWTHFGDGVLFEQLNEYAKRKLNKNIIFNLPGAVTNEELMDIYKNNDFHIFINVSESEGIPVSIMEAISFGIPIIATDVGGVNEIVVNKQNGVLLNKDFKDDDLIKAIREFYNMSDNEYFNYRNNARLFWNENYNAEKNYKDFYDDISNFR